jgi:hypothetical protein
MSVTRSAYPEPPWTYTDASIVNVVCRAADVGAPAELLPDGMDAVDDSGLFSVFFMSVPFLPEMGPGYSSSEFGIVVPARNGAGATGGCFALMLVDNDVALSAGREIWGYPKQLGTIGLHDAGEGRWTATAAHVPFRSPGGEPLARVDVRLDGSRDHVLQALTKFSPRLLVKPVREPASGRQTGVCSVQVDQTMLAVHERRSGTATVDFGSSGQLRRLRQHEVVGALYQRCDFVLPYGSAGSRSAGPDALPAGASSEDSSCSSTPPPATGPHG